MSDSPPPIFVKADLKFMLHGREFDYPDSEVSLYGASGLRTAAFNPIDTIGMEITADVQVRAGVPFGFRTTAHLTSESTADNTFAGMKFELPPSIRDRLSAIIAEKGFYPSVYARKFPRIPARESIPTMPLRAIVKRSEGEMFAMDIANMSPGGVLLHSENARAATLLPSTQVHGHIQPRGHSPNSFEFDGLVCRTLAEMQFPTRNIRRYFGIRFTHIPETQKQSFLEILRMILLNIQEAGLVDPGPH
jgi:hypothetical protein